MDQTTLILSMPHSKHGDETKETLCASQFPSTNVMVGSLIGFKKVKIDESFDRFHLEEKMISFYKFSGCDICTRRGQRTCHYLNICHDLYYY
ncbi:hypothetical protein Hanom_Chr12g01122661 [Helianthus anomalus]